MTFIKSILFSLVISIFLASCNVSEPAKGTNPEPAVPEELTPAKKITMLDPTTTSRPATTFTAEPEPEAQEIEASPTGEKQMPSDSEPTEFAIQPGVENITIAGAEDLPLQTTLYTPGGSGLLPGVVLLHMLGSDRQVWDDNGIANTLVENGYAVLAVDMRGHGETGNSIDWQLAPEDLQRAWKHFTSLDTVDPQRTAVIGASIGANLALLTGADQPAIRTVVLLSPGLDYRGVTSEGPLAKYGVRPILIVASEEDTYAADSSRTLATLANGESRLEMYNGAGHGTRMFDAQPDLSNLIITWLAQNLN
jgi:pimeloyl-ACP methyl ester carboxylesterase